MQGVLAAAALLMVTCYVAVILLVAAGVFRLIEREAKIWAKGRAKKKRRRGFWLSGFLS